MRFWELESRPESISNFGDLEISPAKLECIFNLLMTINV